MLDRLPNDARSMTVDVIARGRPAPSIVVDPDGSRVLAVGRWRTPAAMRGIDADAQCRPAIGPGCMRGRHADMRRFRYRPRRSRF
ncbi:hypothetical protein [Cupriavidus gilardii]|uniref:Uncharacterized protein n=1 Tax=Cupriavidus gilardii TaxID=82541 RepID=A0A849BDB5_9BURK|nr:hypothetical protein [Cupriavidus gilardii]KAB0594782.1 hypothetical protein F7Q96_20615 [Cupriavidus gilardii]MCT9012777.1 hypothetical protein [Cupriavidus gilardii]MCT9054743.1 hypothetical protein [Cupriavidus gilardii]NNH11823.1 hypothetical protein [Cupriavidus gilardii]WNG70940.1 hypothetical protein QWJ31_12240 [Cupriavidus gilardii]